MELSLLISGQPGVGRAVALREGRVREAVIRREDAHRVQAWAFLNSLRGWLPATVHLSTGLHEHLVELQSHRR